MKDATSLSSDQVYDRRFRKTKQFRTRMWKILCHDFFQKYIAPDSCVVEIAAGYCEFINHIQAARRIAIDINPDIHHHAAPGVEIFQASAMDLYQIGNQTADVVFVSNFFEHISKLDMVRCINEIHRILKPDGRILILQPNYRYCWRDYWMFFDHVTPIDDRALVEVLELLGFKIQRCIPRFLPYTTKQRLPQSETMVRWYLKMPFLWSFFGAQTFVCGYKR
jgi:SAM-dependent methyltransferase